MRVERYSDIYFLDVFKLVEKFYHAYLVDIFGKPDNDTLVKTINDNQHLLFLLIIKDSCVGLIAGVDIKSRLNNDRFFQEIIWYVEKPYGRFGFYLIKETMKHLKTLGFSSIIMSVLENKQSSRIKKIYEKQGFKPMETHFVRAL